MSEQIPVFRRPAIPVMGAASDIKKAEVQENIQDHFSNNRNQVSSTFADRLRILEYPKHDFERAAIKDINELLNQVLEELGLPTFDIPEANIYSVPQNLYKEINGHTNIDSDGFAAHHEQAIVLNSENLDHPYSRISVLLHEMIHLKGFVSIEAEEDQTDLRRIGLEAHSSLKKTKEYKQPIRHFIGLNEAVVSELQRRLLSKVISKNPHLAREKKILASEQGKTGLVKATKKEGLPEDEFVYAFTKGNDPEKDDWEAFMFPYRPQRIVLDYIMETIQRTYPEEFPHKDDVFQIFLKAHFSGRLSELARVIEDTFDTGSFRVIGGMTGKDSESAFRVLAYLKKNTPLESRG